MIDYQTIFCDRQVISATTLSNRAVDLQALASYGVGRQLFVNCMPQGTHAHDLRVQILGSKTGDFATDAVVVGDSGVIPVNDLNANGHFFVGFNPIKDKYRYVALRFIPTIEGEASEEVTNGGNGSDVVPNVPEVGVVPADLANGIKAYIDFTPALDIVYPMAREDMGYSA